jgi:hypothetical protein
MWEGLYIKYMPMVIGLASLCAREDMFRWKPFTLIASFLLAGVLLSANGFYSPAASEDNVIVLVGVENTELGMKRIEVQSKVDALIVNDVVVNRGNCKTDTAENAMNQAMPGMGNYAGQLAQLSGVSLKKKGETLKFGEKILFMTSSSCDILELIIKTSQGDVKMEYN